jgi:hypothetical protein
MRSGWISIVLLCAGCGPTGPQLPANVGADHAHPAEGHGPQQPQAPAHPVAVGTDVWANFHDTGFYFHGVVVDRRNDQHHVIYTDGASEWLPSSALLPDSLHEDAQINMRAGYTLDFQEAVIARRLGNALYVRLANGTEVWTGLPHIRFQTGQAGTPRRGDAPRAEGAVPAGQVGSNVFVNYQHQGLRFAGTVTARRENGQLHIVYLDGDTEWADADTVGPDDIAQGTRVHVRRSWEPPVWVRGTVQQRHGAAVFVEFDDGGTAWTSLFRIRVPVDESADRTDVEPGSTTVEPEPGPAQAPTPRRRGRVRRPRPARPPR